MSACGRGLMLTTTTASILGGLTATLVHPDWYPQAAAYGVSAGTSSHYCSADLARSHLEVTCATAQ